MKRERRKGTPQGTGRLAQLKAQLDVRGLRPRKSLGQNFLVDTNFATAVAREADADEHTLLMEVGPGTGFLTQTLLNAHPNARVLAIELDHGLATLLRDTFAESIAAEKLTLLEGDALSGKHGLNEEWLAEAERIARDEDRTRRVLCANLAYNMATPLIANLLVGNLKDGPRASPPAHQDSFALQTNEGGRGPSSRLLHRIIATVQLELAERLVGEPSTPDYGPLAVFAALTTDCRIIRKVGPEVFWPRPQVKSAVLRIELLPWKETPLTPDQAQPFMGFLHQAFGQRRKTLRAALKGTIPAEHDLAGKRAENVNPEELLELFLKIS